MNALPKPPVRRGPPDLNAKAALRVRLAIAELRAAKTSLAKARGWIPRGDVDLEINLEIRKLRDREVYLLALARKLESTERYAGQPEASP